MEVLEPSGWDRSGAPLHRRAAAACTVAGAAAPPPASATTRSSTVRSSAGTGWLVRVARSAILASVRVYWSLVSLSREDATGLLSWGVAGRAAQSHLDDEFLKAAAEPSREGLVPVGDGYVSRVLCVSPVRALELRVAAHR